MTATALAGALIGLGVWGLVRALHPARPSLAEALASLRPVTVAQPIVTPAEATWGPIARLGAPILPLLARSLPPPTSLLSARVHRDLLVVQRSAHRHLAEKLATALIGFLTPTLAASLLTAAGAPIPFALPAVASVALGVAGFFLPDGAVRSEAEKRRDEFREALSVFIDLTSLGLAAGSGPEEAMAEAARVGRGWAFAPPRPAREEVASSIGLAEEKGARIRESLAERATSMRRARLAEAEGKARRASQRMSLPVVLLLVGFIVFIAYPAIERIVSVGQ